MIEDYLRDWGKVRIRDRDGAEQGAAFDRLSNTFTRESSWSISSEKRVNPIGARNSKRLNNSQKKIVFFFFFLASTRTNVRQGITMQVPYTYMEKAWNRLTWTYGQPKQLTEQKIKAIENADRSWECQRAIYQGLNIVRVVRFSPPKAMQCYGFSWGVNPAWTRMARFYWGDIS